jgi:hypothetical protein
MFHHLIIFDGERVRGGAGSRTGTASDRDGNARLKPFLAPLEGLTR